MNFVHFVLLCMIQLSINVGKNPWELKFQLRCIHFVGLNNKS
jgi:hypothetical protein